MKLNLYNDYEDIVINDEIVLHINHNDEGYRIISNYIGVQYTN